MAVHIAKKYPGRRVMVVNTYAGADLMKRSVRRALQFEEVHKIAQLDLVHPTRTEEGAAALNALFPNLFFLDISYGSWDSWEISREVREKGIDILLINSFEFTAITRAKRERIAADLVQLEQQMQARPEGFSMNLFSHEMKRDIEARMPARGAIGILSAHAETVWKIEEPDQYQLGVLQTADDTAMERPSECEKPSELAENSNVHEKQTQVANEESIDEVDLVDKMDVVEEAESAHEAAGLTVYSLPVSTLGLPAALQGA